MSNDIMDLLELNDEDSEVLESKTEGNIKSVTISKIRREMYCPICGCRLHSKGTFTRHPNNQIFQGSYVLKVTLTGRRWECSNPDCDYKETDQFKFIQRYKHNTTFNDISIIREMKDINLSCRQFSLKLQIERIFIHSNKMSRSFDLLICFRKDD